MNVIAIFFFENLSIKDIKIYIKNPLKSDKKSEKDKISILNENIHRSINNKL